MLRNLVRKLTCFASHIAGRMGRTVPVRSAAISRVGYNSRSGILLVRFRRYGKVYRFNAVPRAVHVGLVTAESRGKYFNSTIKRNYPFHAED